MPRAPRPFRTWTAFTPSSPHEPDSTPEPSGRRHGRLRRPPANTSAVDALRVIYATSASLWGFPGPDHVTTTTTVSYEVIDLPAGHDILLETADPTEEGHVSYTLVKTEWADGYSDGEGRRTLPQTTDPDPGGLGRLSAVASALQSGHPVPPPPVGPPRVVREARRTGSTPGRVRRGLLASPPTPRPR